MLKRKAIRKIIITTFLIIIMLIVCIMPNNFYDNDDLLNISMETTYVNNSDTCNIYLLGKNNYLTNVTMLINSDNIEDEIVQIIDYLTINKSSKIPNGFKAIIPETTKLNSVTINDKIAILDFSDSLFDVDEILEERLVEAITYSLIELDGIEGVQIKINGKLVDKLPKCRKKNPSILNRNLGINKVFEFDSIHDIKKVILYYTSNIDNINYYVPVTKYLNDDKEKIKIIIENLSSNYVYDSSLISTLNHDTELINYEINDNVMTLNFNQGIFTNNKLLEDVTYTISQSVFENYDIDKILFQINGKKIEEVEK